LSKDIEIRLRTREISCVSKQQISALKFTLIGEVAVTAVAGIQ